MNPTNLSEFVKAKLEFNDHKIKIMPNAHCPENESFLLCHPNRLEEIMAERDKPIDEEKKILLNHVARLSDENNRLRNALFGLKNILEN